MSAHTTQTELKFLGKLILEGELHCETGLHVGAGKGSLEIGGSDNPVVKDAFGRPYVPGSSLRGKLRSLLEQTSGMAVPSELVYLSKRKGQEVRIHQSDRPDDEICLLFGRNPGRMDRVAGESIDGMAAGLDSFVWFLKNGLGGPALGKIDPGTGVITFYATGLLGPSPQLGGITAGPDANIWFTDYYNGLIGNVTATGSITEYPTGVTGTALNSITLGPLVAGAKTLWLTDPGGNKIVRATLP